MVEERNKKDGKMEEIEEQRDGTSKFLENLSSHSNFVRSLTDHFRGFSPWLTSLSWLCCVAYRLNTIPGNVASLFKSEPQIVFKVDRDSCS